MNEYSFYTIRKSEKQTMKYLLTLSLLSVLAGCSSTEQNTQSKSKTAVKPKSESSQLAQSTFKVQKRNLSEQMEILGYANSLRKMCNENIVILYEEVGKKFGSVNSLTELQTSETTTKLNELKLAFNSGFSTAAQLTPKQPNVTIYAEKTEQLIRTQIQLCSNAVKVSAENLIKSIEQQVSGQIASWQPNHYKEKYELLYNAYKLEAMELSTTTFAQNRLINYQLNLYKLLATISSLQNQPSKQQQLASINRFYKGLTSLKEKIDKDFNALSGLHFASTLSGADKNNLPEKSKIEALNRATTETISETFELVTQVIEILNKDETDDLQRQSVAVLLDTTTTKAEEQLPQLRFKYLQLFYQIAINTKKAS